MTVSHVFYNSQILDCSVNYETHLKTGAAIEYNPKDPGFLNLVQAIALGSKATFSYNPTDDEMRTYHALKQGKKADALKNVELTDE